MKIYLATPYSHKDNRVRSQRFLKINKVAADLMKQGHIIFSPISHSHPISLTMDNAMDADFYLKQDAPFIDWADALIAVTFSNDPEPSACYDSYGLQWEIEQAEELGLQVKWMEI